MHTDISKADPQKNIIIKGARLHNLKNVDVVLPRNQLIVVTGVSGSGKSSLTIDTLYAEGQRRYVESLNSYARQFLTRKSKPEIDYIKGISPAIAIEQKVANRNTRSTVGTLTEIYDYFRLMYARIGTTYSPISKKQVRKHAVTDVVDFIIGQAEGTKVQILIPFRLKESTTVKAELDLILQKGYSRIQVEGALQKIEDVDPEKIDWTAVNILIDRLVVKHEDQDFLYRAADSVQIAFFESLGDCFVEILGDKIYPFSNRFELDGIKFEEPNPHFFNFNSPFGACQKCQGTGQIIGIDTRLVIPDPEMSVYEGGIACWKTEKMSLWRDKMVKSSHHFDFPIHRSISQLSPEEYELLWTGNEYFDGLNAFFKFVEEQSFKIQYRVMLSKYRGRTVCTECKQSRLRKDVQHVLIDGKSIVDMVLMPIKKLRIFMENIQLSDYEQEVCKRILLEINNRLGVMDNIGLGYLNLNRLSSTLSGGETQRINLTRSLGSNLTNSMYILDEPSIGLHPRDTQRLIEVLKRLRDLGNTVIVVEHEEEVIRAADYLLDMGPLAGHLGGEVVFSGTPDKLIAEGGSLTADYLLGSKTVHLEKVDKKLTDFIVVEKAQEHNLKEITVRFPLDAITVVSGVSGSGKTTLVKKILYPALRRKIDSSGNAPGLHKGLSGDLDHIKKIELIDQNPLGKSSRSNPVTYIKAFNAIRDLFSNHKLSKLRGFKPKHFSFNVEGGRCEMCEGSGTVTIEMQFLADVHLVCEECNGQRFKQEVLEVTYNDKNISQVLDMSVDEALIFFKNNKDIASRIQPLSDVGLGYVRLGQPSSTLSGGEAQRVKLASYLGKSRSTLPILFIFDEPSTGLHFNDINKLLKAFKALVQQGHTIIIVEHNMDIIKCADWVIDLGPEGGDEGGDLLYEGPPKGLLKVKRSYTAQYLEGKI